MTRTASPNRAALLRRYRELVLDELPRRARKAHWIVIHDHCFGRVVLDDTVGGCWYDVLDRRRSPAFAQLDDEQVSNAVALAERIAAEGDPLLPDRDARSLAWRGMAPKPGRGRSPGDGEAGPLALNALVKGCVTIFGTHTRVADHFGLLGAGGASVPVPLRHRRPIYQSSATSARVAPQFA